MATPSSMPAAGSSPDAPFAWWGWLVLAVLACMGLGLFLVSHNPASAMIDRVTGKAHEALAQGLGQGNDSPLMVWADTMLRQFTGLTRPQCLTIGLGYALGATMLPLAVSFLLAMPSHGIFLAGGAAGGWRGTARCFAQHRLMCEAATLVLLILVLKLRLPLATAAFLLLIGLPLIRIVSTILLWILLARMHAFGALRAFLLGPPGILLAAFFSTLYSLGLALYVLLYLVALSL